MIKQLTRAAATAVLGLSLTTGFAAADIGNTGPSSHNSEKSKVTSTAIIKNNNDLSASNENSQSTKSGTAGVYHNTTGGSATSGDASNSSSFSASATVDNSSSDGVAADSASSDPGSLGNINETGPDSNNTISSKVSNKVVEVNNNDLTVTSTNCQNASTGNATVAGNTTGGSATSGSASNTSSSSVDFDVTN
jgi:hypothetical protein